MTRAGDLRQHGRLQRPTRVDSPLGGSELIYEDAGVAWCALGAPRMGERIEAGRVDGIATHRLEFRFRDDVRGGWRFVPNGRVFRILATSNPDGRRRMLICLAEEEGR